MAQNPIDKDDRELGLAAAITRRDFLNTTLLGSGAGLLAAMAPLDWLQRSALQQGTDEFTGYGGTGDYARSNGNTLPVLQAAHRLRDGAYRNLPANTTDTGQTYDLIIVGGGLSGLTAAWAYQKATGGAKRCLVLENHPIFGGEAKQNEFVVRGTRLVAPQGSNQFGAPRAGSGSLSDEVWSDLGLPRAFEYQPMHESVSGLRVPLDNYAHMDGVNEAQVDVGYFFDDGGWRNNIWGDDLARAPFSEEVKRDLLKWRTTGPPETGDAFRRSLDTMTYAEFLEKKLGYRSEVTQYIAPVVGLINGISPDAVSAFASSQIGMPGVTRPRGRTGPLPQSFPGGNSTLARHFVKHLVRGAISGEKTLEGVHNGRVDFSALTKLVRPRASASAQPCSVCSTPGPATSSSRLFTRRVVVCSGCTRAR